MFAYTQSLRVSASLQESVDRMSLTIRSKPFQDKEVSCIHIAYSTLYGYLPTNWANNALLCCLKFVPLLLMVLVVHIRGLCCKTCLCICQQDLLPMCYRCSTTNSLLRQTGNACTSCRQPLEFSFVSFG